MVVRETTTAVIEEPDELFVYIRPDEDTIELGTWLPITSMYEPSPPYTDDDINYYSWTPINGLSCIDCPNPVAAPFNTTEYTLTVSYLDGGCIATQTMELVVLDGDDIFVPNMFTPNFDQVNDVVNVFGRDIRTAHFVIFDRWGEKVFETWDQHEGWDGIYKGEMSSPGVYVYYVDVEYTNGKEIQKRGSVTLVR